MDVAVQGPRSVFTCAALAILAAPAFAAPAAAQDAEVPAPPRWSEHWRAPADTGGPCMIFATESRNEGVSDVRAACGGHGIVLGAATGYEAITSEDLQATLVDLRLGSLRRVVLLTLQSDGQPLLEDLTGQLALAAGRGPMSDLEGVELDLGQFVRSGVIGVRGQAQDTGPRKAARVELAPQVASARARFGDGTPRDRE
jgi:hypothetical protein